MRKTLFLPSVRPKMMLNFLTSLDNISTDWDLLVAFQAYTPDDFDLLKKHKNFGRITDYIEFETRQFPYPTRVQMYKKWQAKYDVWGSVDDDMEFLETVNYAPIVERIIQPGVGVVSGNWVRHETFLRRIKPAEEWIEQPLINMAGGQFFTSKIVDILLKGEVKPYLFCDIEVALKAYVEGYQNFRYRGSLIIHRTMAKQGLAQTFREQVMDLPDPLLCKVRPCAQTIKIGNNWHMPVASDVTKLAHYHHQKKKAKRMNDDKIYWRYS